MKNAEVAAVCGRYPIAVQTGVDVDVNGCLNSQHCIDALSDPYGQGGIPALPLQPQL
jgi:hypothetical protein